MRAIYMPALAKVKSGLLVLLALPLMPSLRAAGAPAAETYLLQLQALISSTRTNLPALTRSAEQAADGFVAGGRLWAAGRQADFIAEACGRAGGLMAIAPLGKQNPTKQDVVLLGVPGPLEANENKLLKEWQAQGVIVIPFASPAGLFQERCPVDTVANILDLWTWTGEFVAACTRRDKTPVLYLSYGLPGGPERGKKYKGHRFHADLNLQPIAAGVVGRQYLDQIAKMLGGIREKQLSKIIQAARWWQQSTSATTMVIGHMFPRHAQDIRTKTNCQFASVPAWEDKELLDSKHPPQFVPYLGYQSAPGKLVEQAKALGVKLLYTAVKSAEPPEPAGNILYLDPAWPLADGCVTLPGYDIPILPASGVIQAAIYWTLDSERGITTP